MKALVVESFGAPFTLADVDLADPIGREVLVEVKASGLCHSDLAAAQYDLGLPVPSVLGHEVAGVVVGLGPEVTEFAIGDHVVGCLVQYCGRCDRCLSGRINQCRHPEATLRSADQPPRLSLNSKPLFQGMGLGGFAERSLIHESQLVRLPDGMPFPQAALMGCGVATGAGAVINTARVQAGDAVVVIGCGGVGLNAISGAITAGATTIIAVDIADEKLETARRVGATHVVNSKATDPVAAVQEITGDGADAVFDFVGLPEATKQGWEMANKGGGLYLIGSINPETSLAFTNIEAVVMQKRVQGVYMGSTVPKRDLPMYAELYLAGRFNLDDLVSKEISLDQVNEGYQALHDPSVTRVVITSF
ncbi:zinc-binding dehydrogenase [Streptomyces sp. NBC_01320]|uniref:zinc-binding dehydrogenase n=1 Tax=Streptomyces sp. NBC_01320 TaxID=2903824 RepID=UPI002E0EDEEB|nr:zinc-binding dehydrogenase [Streptomyces sp. NBC_01320]